MSTISYNNSYNNRQCYFIVVKICYSSANLKWVWTHKSQPLQGLHFPLWENSRAKSKYKTNYGTSGVRIRPSPSHISNEYVSNVDTLRYIGDTYRSIIQNIISSLKKKQYLGYIPDTRHNLPSLIRPTWRTCDSLVVSRTIYLQEMQIFRSLILFIFIWNL